MNILFLISVYEDLFLEYIQSNKNLFQNFYGVAYGKNKRTQNKAYKDVIYFSEFMNHAAPLSDHEILAIQEFELIAKVNIADCIHADRHIIKIHKSKRELIASRILLATLNLISDENINIIFSEGADDFLSLFLSKYFYNSDDVKFVYAIPSRLGNLYHFSDNINNAPIGYEKRFKSHIELKDFERAKEFILDYVSKRSQPSYINSSLNFRFISWFQIKSFFIYMRRFFKEKNTLHINENPFRLIIRKINKVLIVFRYGLLKKYSPNYEDDKYFIFPLQLIPEAATLIQGRKLNNMLSIIEIISKSLPFGIKLMVKEHPLCIGRREFKIYRELRNFHNVELLRHDIELYPLIQHSLGVITISSSMSLEALLLGKPAGFFGDIYFQNLTNAYSMKNLYEIDRIINLMLNNKHHWDEIYALVSTILDSGFPANMDPVTYSDLDKLPPLQKYLKEFS